MASLNVGIREAKASLSKLLRMVKEGNEVVLTDRGRPVGKIVPIGRRVLSLAARIREMEDAGTLESVNGKSPKGLPPPIPVEQGIAQRLLKEDREGAS